MHPQLYPQDDACTCSQAERKMVHEEKLVWEQVGMPWWYHLSEHCLSWSQAITVLSSSLEAELGRVSFGLIAFWLPCRLPWELSYSLLWATALWQAPTAIQPCPPSGAALKAHSAAPLSCFTTLPLCLSSSFLVWWPFPTSSVRAATSCHAYRATTSGWLSLRSLDMAWGGSSFSQERSQKLSIEEGHFTSLYTAKGWFCPMYCQRASFATGFLCVPLLPDRSVGGNIPLARRQWR